MKLIYSLLLCGALNAATVTITVKGDDGKTSTATITTADVVIAGAQGRGPRNRPGKQDAKAAPVVAPDQATVIKGMIVPRLRQQTVTTPAVKALEDQAAALQKQIAAAKEAQVK